MVFLPDATTRLGRHLGLVDIYGLAMATGRLSWAGLGQTGPGRAGPGRAGPGLAGLGLAWAATLPDQTRPDFIDKDNIRVMNDDTTPEETGSECE